MRKEYHTHQCRDGSVQPDGVVQLLAVSGERLERLRTRKMGELTAIPAQHIELCCLKDEVFWKWLLPALIVCRATL